MNNQNPQRKQRGYKNANKGDRGGAYPALITGHGVIALLPNFSNAFSGKFSSRDGVRERDEVKRPVTALRSRLPLES
jgi:hypothetical protein